MKRILYFAVVWMCISTVSHAVQPAPEIIAESEKALFGKLKLWEIEKISPHLYAYRYTFYRNFFLIGEDGIILTDPLTVEAAKILDTELRKISDKPIKYVAYSHSHWDHISVGQFFNDMVLNLLPTGNAKRIG